MQGLLRWISLRRVARSVCEAARPPETRHEREVPLKGSIGLPLKGSIGLLKGSIRGSVKVIYKGFFKGISKGSFKGGEDSWGSG